MSAVCRSLPPTMFISVTANEKTDPQIDYVRDREVPTIVIWFIAPSSSISQLIRWGTEFPRRHKKHKTGHQK